ncbi:phosphate regulon transcriptional regulator PhoB [Thiolapillus brandeum]|uniref:Phosphate regulon transcriptional regulatory protein PhoB n=1 Tax=Thiolapillus brandeum TaxID=1076588 RepID=A0A7U6JKK7_9GAMM|nr:phosphate regulon transcriptional regulator PhoB [Thiolapillus brandeum]BAO45415.1 two-component system OmpR family phosphate regulon response regulator PhoB [Thiolapillus brandeum]
MPVILLVEDESPIRDMVRFALSRAGMEMLDAEDVAYAEQVLQQRRPDLILLDWMLPDENGIGLLRRLRKDTERKDIPVIMLTAMAEEEQKIKGLEVGADDYITKPFSPPELVARIKAVLRRAIGADATGILRIGNLSLNTLTHSVKCRDRTIELGPTEYRLLEFLLSHPNRVYRRAQLLDYVWVDADAPEERTVDVSVRRLRKVLDPAGCEGLIKTVRGAGYSLSGKEDSA